MHAFTSLDEVVQGCTLYISSIRPKANVNSIRANLGANPRRCSLSLSKLALIGIVPTKDPTRIELQEWVNVNLIDPTMVLTKIRMLPRGYFALTFEAEQGALEALQQSSLNFGTHQLVLYPWKPQFNSTKSIGMKIIIWIKFPKLDDCYYRVLPKLCSSIREVV